MPVETRRRKLKRPSTQAPLSLPHLRMLRERAFLSQNELAEKSGVSRFTVQRLEAGHGVAHRSTVRKLAAALGCEPINLVPYGVIT